MQVLAPSWCNAKKTRLSPKTKNVRCRRAAVATKLSKKTTCYLKQKHVRCRRAAVATKLSKKTTCYLKQKHVRCRRAAVATRLSKKKTCYLKKKNMCAAGTQLLPRSYLSTEPGCKRGMANGWCVSLFFLFLVFFFLFFKCVWYLRSDF